MFTIFTWSIYGIFAKFIPKTYSRRNPPVQFDLNNGGPRTGAIGYLCRYGTEDCVARGDVGLAGGPHRFRCQPRSKVSQCGSNKRFTSVDTRALCQY